MYINVYFEVQLYNDSVVGESEVGVLLQLYSYFKYMYDTGGNYSHRCQ